MVLALIGNDVEDIVDACRSVGEVFNHLAGCAAVRDVRSLVVALEVLALGSGERLVVVVRADKARVMSDLPLRVDGSISLFVLPLE
ncbi:dipeptidase [Pyrolobus fumarii 1A]|uniref:Dipeptidase n=1 Tax=Pyrolobus fumarii (strain DSM 11204 / 1A) TaxID=694429 RepID=G0ECB7_PYRF1|nr:hypothetical protein [Pyrolobus fumarii]AEM39487.1 dipeptidase [Pyrolobus fumarii 1A]